MSTIFGRIVEKGVLTVNHGGEANVRTHPARPSARSFPSRALEDIAVRVNIPELFVSLFTTTL